MSASLSRRPKSGRCGSRKKMTNHEYLNERECGGKETNEICPTCNGSGGIDVIKFVELFLGEQLIEFHRRMAEEHLRRLIEMEERSE